MSVYPGDDPRSRLRPRPYVLTGGRTTPAIPLADETTVRVPRQPTGASKIGATARPMHRQAMVDYCEESRTVAAIAEQFDLPILVAKVLVADLVVSGLLETQLSNGDRPDLRLLERVLEGLSS